MYRSLILSLAASIMLAANAYAANVSDPIGAADEAYDAAMAATAGGVYQLDCNTAAAAKQALQAAIDAQNVALTAAPNDKRNELSVRRSQLSVDLGMVDVYCPPTGG